MENKGIYQCYKRNRKIPIAKKLEYIELAKIKGKNAVAKIEGVSSKTIRKWRKIIFKYKIFKIIQNDIIKNLFTI